MASASTWTLTGAATEYTVAVDESGRWLSLVAWGPHGGDVGAVEYATDGLRPFLGPDLVLDARSAYWDFADADSSGEGLRATFVDPVTGLRAVQCYRFAPGTDVVERW